MSPGTHPLSYHHPLGGGLNGPIPKPLELWWNRKEHQTIVVVIRQPSTIWFLRVECILTQLTELGLSNNFDVLCYSLYFFLTWGSSSGGWFMALYHWRINQPLKGNNSQQIAANIHGCGCWRLAKVYHSEANFLISSFRAAEPGKSAEIEWVN